MSVTEVLRRLLDERGVEWWPMHDVENGYHQDRDTEFVIDGKKYTAHEWGGTLNVYGLTPEQAVEATLGPLTEQATKDSEKDSDGCGTCRAEETDTWECVCDQIGRYGKRVTIHVMECSACGQTFEHVNGAYKYCPHCRRRMVIE